MTDERYFINRKELEKIEVEYIKTRHVERYAMARQFLRGRVLDCACGCGYGTFLVSKNPDIKLITGIDSDWSTIAYAKNQYNETNIDFFLSDIESFEGNYDILLSIETIEHLQQPEMLVQLAERIGAKEIILSFPSKKTTHYNPFHHHDFRLQDIKDLFSQYECIVAVDLWNEVKLTRMVRKYEF